MKNQVTVTVKMPWILNLQDDEYRKLYTAVHGISKDVANRYRQEARYMVAGMSLKRSEYSYEAVPSEVNLGAYAYISQRIHDHDLDVQVSKSGEHVQTGPKNDVKYYNYVDTCFADGKIKSQGIGHLDGNVTDFIPSDSSHFRLDIKSMKDFAVSNALNNTTAVQASEAIQPSRQPEISMSM